MIKILVHKNSFRVYLFLSLVVIEFLATTTLHMEVMESMWDKANHFIAFFVLYMLLTFAYIRFSILFKSLLLLVFGLQIEIVQNFIEGRFFSLLDVFADLIGIMIGIVVVWLIEKVQYD